jgi:mitochondrial chaperone BCS1
MLPHGSVGSSSPPPFLMKYFPDFLATNPYFSAGFGLAGIGFAATSARTLYSTTKLILKRRLLTTLEIPSKDQSYQWVMQWLVKNAQNSLGHRHVGVETMHAKDSTGKLRTAFSFVPSPGRHVMTFQNKLLIVDRDRSQQTVDITTGAPWETVTLTTFAWNKPIFQTLLDSARKEALEADSNKTLIYHPSGNDWRIFGQPKPIRPFDSVVLEQGLSEQIVADIQNFLSHSNWYKDRGIPYRRGYLLYGPPGTGKTSSCLAIAGLLKYNIATINLGDSSISDDRLFYLLAHLPPETILLLEDIDAAVEKDVGTDNGYRRLSFSGLLNALDGVAATDERIIFMTTNRINVLPSALIRPGRVDLKVHVGLASVNQLERMFLRFYPGELEKAKEFGSLLEGAPLSMAEVQGFFLFFKDDPANCLKEAKKLGEDAKRERLKKITDSP